MVSCRLLISQSESRISSDTDLSEIMSNNVSVDPDTKPQDEPQFKNVVPLQLLSRHIKYVETTNNSNREANLLYMENTQLEIS